MYLLGIQLRWPGHSQARLPGESRVELGIRRSGHFENGLERSERRADRGQQMSF